MKRDGSFYLETNKRDLHGEDGAQAVDCAVSHIYAVWESACEHQNQDVEGNKVDEEHVATPGGNLNAHRAHFMTKVTLQCTQYNMQISCISSPCRSKPAHTWTTNTPSLFSQPWSTCSRSTACRRWQYLSREDHFLIILFCTFGVYPLMLQLYFHYWLNI